jgi:PTS system fructose-specific IIA component/PTS system nitrogen regulatory IIA component
MDLLSTLCVARPQLAASTKEECIYLCVAALVEGGWVRPGDLMDVVLAVSRREQLGSTGIGRTVAMPHSRHPGIDRMVSGWFTLASPVDWDSLDGEPVQVICCLLSPQDRPGDHLRALEAAVMAIKDDEFVAALIRCQTEDEMRAVLASPRPW